MAHEAARHLLEQALTRAEREEAIRKAMQLGMPLHEIQEFLDWLDAIRFAASQNNG
jgi:DNA-binding transcriptional MerR regulator